MKSKLQSVSSSAKTMNKTQAPHIKKTRIIMQIDEDVVAKYKRKADTEGKNYLHLMNDALKTCLQGQLLIDEVKRTIQEELKSDCSTLLKKA